MTAQELKEHVYENDLIEQVLSEIGCHHIKKHSNFWTAANPDGDNQSAIVVYDNENLTTINYTRQLVKTPRATDIFDLIAFLKDCTFPEALREVCNICGIDFYQEPQEIPESLQILRMLKEMSLGEAGEDQTPVKPISEDILSYYLPYGNILFEQDNIPLDIQKEFGVGYDSVANYITIPIYDALANLVGVKGRYFGDPDDAHPKYIYLERCNKSRILYGYSQNIQHIKNSNKLFIVESEKAVMQLAGIGIRNVVASGGKTISKYQIELITRTGCTPIFAFDADVQKEELVDIANMFVKGIDVYAVIDTDNILEEKQSPSDDPNKFLQLVKNNIYKLERNE